jgi:uncharacterized protein YjbI with pentapeptide repeats
MQKIIERQKRMLIQRWPALLLTSLVVLSLALYVSGIHVVSHARPTKENSSNQAYMGKRMEGALLEGKDLHETMLAGVRLKKATLKNANLRKAMLAGADLRQVNFQHADLHGAMLLGANLSGADLSHANLEEAMLWAAQLEGARIDGANFANAFVSQDQIDDACGKPNGLPPDFQMPKPC